MQRSAVRTALGRHARLGSRYLAGAAGGLCADWATWTVLVALFGHPVLAQAFGKLAGGVFGFFAYRRFVFRVHAAPPHGQAVRFVCAATFSGILSVNVVAILIPFMAGPLAKISADGITFAVNYAVMRTLVFRVRAEAAPVAGSGFRSQVAGGGAASSATSSSPSSAAGTRATSTMA